MMTLEEIRSAQINPTAAREAYNHADRRLMDTLETKKFFEQKAFTLFGAYVTAATALLGIGVALLKDNYWNYLSTPFLCPHRCLSLVQYFSFWRSWTKRMGRWLVIPICG
ncbi:MAG TPA: hypothetical protein VKB96_11640 [Gammaproteobacteria bacterium]|nr:hypothetical protein [Gammaproteobacteria bacterium]